MCIIDRWVIACSLAFAPAEQQQSFNVCAIIDPRMNDYGLVLLMVHASTSDDAIERKCEAWL